MLLIFLVVQLNSWTLPFVVSRYFSRFGSCALFAHPCFSDLVRPHSWNPAAEAEDRAVHESTLASGIRHRICKIQHNVWLARVCLVGKGFQEPTRSHNKLLHTILIVACFASLLCLLPAKAKLSFSCRTTLGRGHAVRSGSA